MSQCAATCQKEKLNHFMHCHSFIIASPDPLLSCKKCFQLCQLGTSGLFSFAMRSFRMGNPCNCWWLSKCIDKCTVGKYQNALMLKTRKFSLSTLVAEEVKKAKLVWWRYIQGVKYVPESAINLVPVTVIPSALLHWLWSGKGSIKTVILEDRT